MEHWITLVFTVLSGATLSLVALIYRQLHLQLSKNSTDMDDVKARLIRIEEHTPNTSQQLDNARERERTANLLDSVAETVAGLAKRLDQHIEDDRHGRLN